MSEAILTINSRNYGAWSLRGWLLCRAAGLSFSVEMLDHDDDANRSELLLLSPSLLVPRLEHGEVVVWGSIAIAEYLNELAPEQGLLPADRAERALCRSISGEMHSGFANLRSALPMNLKARYEDYPIWSGPQADLDRIEAIWVERLGHSGGPFLFGERFGMADALQARIAEFRNELLHHAIASGEVAAGLVPVGRDVGQRRRRRLRRADPGAARHGRVDRPGPRGVRRARRARDGVLSPRRLSRWRG